jgi:hypothetical protein
LAGAAEHFAAARRLLAEARETVRPVLSDGAEMPATVAPILTEAQHQARAGADLLTADPSIDRAIANAAESVAAKFEGYRRGLGERSTLFNFSTWTDSDSLLRRAERLISVVSQVATKADAERLLAQVASKPWRYASSDDMYDIKIVTDVLPDHLRPDVRSIPQDWDWIAVLQKRREFSEQRLRMGNQLAEHIAMNYSGDELRDVVRHIDSLGVSFDELTASSNLMSDELSWKVAMWRQLVPSNPELARGTSVERQAKQRLDEVLDDPSATPSAIIDTIGSVGFVAPTVLRSRATDALHRIAQAYSIKQPDAGIWRLLSALRHALALPDGETFAPQVHAAAGAVFDALRTQPRTDHVYSLWVDLAFYAPHAPIGGSTANTLRAHIAMAGGNSQINEALRVQLARARDEAITLSRKLPDDPFVSDLQQSIATLVERNIARLDGRHRPTGDEPNGYLNFPDYGEISQLASELDMLHGLAPVRPEGASVSW